MTNSTVPTSPLLLQRPVLALLLLLCALTLAHGATTPRPRQGISLRSQAAALLDWKSTLKHYSEHQLGTWSSNVHPCNWTGVTCSDVVAVRHHRSPARTPAITRLSLQGANLVGQLDTLRFQSLPYLTSLDLSDNAYLSGTIPPGISSLSLLSIFNISGDHLSGEIPPTVGDLGRLTKMDLSNNNLSGQIPPALGNLSRLTSLYLFGNNLTGNIPWQLGKLQDIEYLDLSSNLLHGEIPSTLGNLTNLNTLALSAHELD
nr:unnamed protein product [Digitaria exilis]